MASPSAARPIPPLNALRTFEVAGRLQSIRGAANELVVTPGAVSRQVRLLESWLGVTLFRHAGRSVLLTDAGLRYHGVVSEHLSAIAAATEELTGRTRSEGVLRIRSYTLFATNWLLPRLTQFHRGQPWVELQLTTSSQPEDFGGHDVDAEIRAGRVKESRLGRPHAAHDPLEWPGFEVDHLVCEELVLVCSPAYQDEHRLREANDLLRLGGDELLRSIASPRLWQRWLEAAGVEGLDPDRGPSFGDSVLTCHAAAAGQGVCLAPRALVDNDLASGRLVIPFSAGSGLCSDFFLVYPPDQLNRRAFRAFRRWILAEIADQRPQQMARIT